MQGLEAESLTCNSLGRSEAASEAQVNHRFIVPRGLKDRPSDHVCDRCVDAGLSALEKSLPILLPDLGAQTSLSPGCHIAGSRDASRPTAQLRTNSFLAAAAKNRRRSSVSMVPKVIGLPFVSIMI